MTIQDTELSSHQGQRHGEIVAVTLVGDDLPSLVTTYQDALGQRLAHDLVVDTELAASWGATACSGRPGALLTPPADGGSYLRLIAGLSSTQAASPDSLRRTLGWAALELTVQDADALHHTLRDDERFRILGPPASLPGLDVIYPMQAQGPAGEVLYLNEVRGDLPGQDLPRARCEVDRVFIVVLAAPDLEESLEFYRDQLGFHRVDRYEIPYRMINTAFDLPSDTKHHLATTGVGSRVNVEIDQYPEAALPRATATDDLPPAMAMVSFTVDSLEPHRSHALGPQIQREEPPYFGRPSLVRRGPAGELVELIGL